MKSKIVCIEGNIGAGKTSLLVQLQRHFSNRKDIVFVTEPVEEFMTFQEHFKPFESQELRPYHESVAVQIHITNVLIKHYFNVFTKFLNSEVQLIICDRYIHAVPVFIEGLGRLNYISDFSHAILLTHVKNNLLRVLPQADYVYYLQPPLTIEQRIAKRGRKGECGFWPVDTLRYWMKSIPDMCWRAKSYGNGTLAHKDWISSLKTSSNLLMTTCLNHHRSNSLIFLSPTIQMRGWLMKKMMILQPPSHWKKRWIYPPPVAPKQPPRAVR